MWPPKDVKMIDYQHLTLQGLQCPTFLLTLEGVPPELEQAILRESDAWLRQMVWVQCVTQQATGPRKHVGPGTSVVLGPRMEGENPRQELAKQEPWSSPQSDGGDGEDEDMNSAGEV